MNGDVLNMLVTEEAINTAAEYANKVIKHLAYICARDESKQPCIVKTESIIRAAEKIWKINLNFDIFDFSEFGFLYANKLAMVGSNVLWTKKGRTARVVVNENVDAFTQRFALVSALYYVLQAGKETNMQDYIGCQGVTSIIRPSRENLSEKPAHDLQIAMEANVFALMVLVPHDKLKALISESIHGHLVDEIRMEFAVSKDQALSRLSLGVEF